jgi:hypothetical protein
VTDSQNEVFDGQRHEVLRPNSVTRQRSGCVIALGQEIAR